MIFSTFAITGGQKHSETALLHVRVDGMVSHLQAKFHS